MIYNRVSTREQVENLSLDTQRRACLAYCEQNGWAVRRVFVEEGESAKTANRPQLREMIQFCGENRGGVQHVVVYKIDRFSRLRYDHVVLAAHLNGLGVTLKSATEHIDETSTGKLMENVLSAIAQFDNDVRRDRTIDGMTAALRAGRWTFAVPLGYRRVIDSTGRKSIEPDPATASLVGQAFEMMSTGRYTKADVLRKITALGLKTAKGKALSMQTFQETLRKPIYAGILEMPKWGIDGVEGNFAPVVDRTVFDRVQNVLDGTRLSVTPHGRNHQDFPLRRFAHCGVCNTPLTGSWSKGRNHRYPYYRCRTRGCLAVKLSKEAFEGEFLEFLNGLRPKPEFVRLFREIVLDVWKQKRAEKRAARVQLERRIEDLEERRDKLVEAHVYRGTIDETVYQRQNDKLSEEIAFARTQLHEEEMAEIDVEGVLNFAETVILDARRLWIEGDLGQRQRLQKVLFPKGVTYDPETGFGTAETALFFRWLSGIPSTESRKASPTGFEPGQRESSPPSKKPANTRETEPSTTRRRSSRHPKLSRSVP